MTPEQLRYLVEVISKGSYSEAANSIYCTPQAVSRGIKELENEFGLTLFNKNEGKASTPTRDAVILARYSQRALMSFEDVKMRAELMKRRLSHEGSIRLGIEVSPYRGCPVAQADFAGFRDKWPRVEMSFAPICGMAWRSMILDGTIDAAVVVSHSNSPLIQMHPLFTETPVAVVSKASNLSNGPWIDARDIEGSFLASPYLLDGLHSLIESIMLRSGAEPHFQSIPPLIEGACTICE